MRLWRKFFLKKFAVVSAREDNSQFFYSMLEPYFKRKENICIQDYYYNPGNHQAVSSLVEKYKNDIVRFSITHKASLCVISFVGGRRNMSSYGYRSLQSAYNADYYTKNCGGYEIFELSHGEVLEGRLCDLLALVQAAQGEQVLDVGCGRGELAYAISKTGAEVMAVDYSADAITIAKQTYPNAQHLKFICKDVLELQGMQFDKIVMADVVEHIEQPMLEAFLRKAAGMLTEKGILIIHTAPNKNYYKFEYPKKVEAALQLGLFLPNNPRSYYEEIMHINEQDPDGLKATLESCFRCVYVWTGNLGDAATEKKQEQQNMDTHIFALASNCEESLHTTIEKCMKKPQAEKVAVNLKILDIDQQMPKRGEIVLCRLQITNLGEQALNSYQVYSINLCYHILSADTGEMFVFDGERSKLSHEIKQGEESIEVLRIRIPQDLIPGKYKIKITLVAENCFWFDSLPDGICIPFETEVL